ncbi:MAG: 1,4-dihydroxy-2-naphthoate polyprenyltransferase [Chlamydiia bacterium]|nr:1,4-dihydroxy-2-naphthoate polyprenyltransferase [Chlamydiia bacterium]
MKLWIEGARPKTLIASLSPVLIGSVIAFRMGPFHWGIFFACALFALAVQIGTNFANDYIDFLKGADTKERKGPRRLVQAGLVTPQKMRLVTFAIFGVAALLGFYLMALGGWQIGVLALLAILFGYLYTGGPYPLGYLGLGDLFVLIFFGPVAAAGVTYLQTGLVSPVAILAGFPPGLLSTAILTMNNLRDQKQDQKVGKKTLPVRFGTTFGKLEFASCILGAAIIPLLQKVYFPTIGTLFLGIPLIRLVLKAKKSEELAPLFPKVGQLQILYTLIFCLSWGNT